MRNFFTRPSLVSPPGFALLTLLLALPNLAHADFQREFSVSGNELRVASLVGEFNVVGHSGDEFEITVDVRGADADEKLIDFVLEEGRIAELSVRFPTDEYRRYVYPGMGRGRTQFSPSRRGRSLLSDLLSLGRDRIEVRGRSWRNAIELWTEITVRVPHGKDANVFLGVGGIKASDVRGDLSLDNQSGRCEADNIEGNLDIDTGSGSVQVRTVKGDLNVDTGSGSVRVHDVEDARVVNVDTGSGSVLVEGVKVDDVKVDTGSGSVDVKNAQARRIEVDTGSGGVDLLRIETHALLVDTGSGGVDIDLVKMGRGEYRVDTGSGGIRMEVPSDVSADFDVDTGSGGVHVDIEGVELTRRQRRNGEARFTVRSGDSEVRLSTGSGSIRIVQN